MIEKIVSFHRKVMLTELDTIEHMGPRLSKEEMYIVAKKIYEEEYKGKIPLEEVEKYNPSNND